MSLEAAAAPRRRLICGFLAPSSSARANVPIDLHKGASVVLNDMTQEVINKIFYLRICGHCGKILYQCSSHEKIKERR